MTREAPKGSWVEVHRIVLEAGQRAPRLPDDTRRVALEMKVKGFLVRRGTIGEEVEIVTPAGRTITGTLMTINPAYAHHFGAPIPELSTVGLELRQLLRDRRQ